MCFFHQFCQHIFVYGLKTAIYMSNTKYEPFGKSNSSFYVGTES